jgi:PAS domain S-box-containing protein
VVVSPVVVPVVPVSVVVPVPVTALVLPGSVSAVVLVPVAPESVWPLVGASVVFSPVAALVVVVGAPVDAGSAFVVSRVVPVVAAVALLSSPQPGDSRAQARSAGQAGDTGERGRGIDIVATVHPDGAVSRGVMRGAWGRRERRLTHGECRRAPDLSQSSVTRMWATRRWYVVLPLSGPDVTEQELTAKVAALEARVEELERERRALREREHWLRTVFDSIPAGIWFADSAGRILLGNPAARRIWGGARYVGVEHYGEYKGWWADTNKPIEPEEWALTRALKGETSLDEVIDIECFDGARKTILNSCTPMYDEGGAMAGVIVINLDITAQKQAERRLHEALERLRFHAENSPLATIEWSEDFRVIAWNAAAERMFGWRADEALGRSIRELGLVHGEDIEGIEGIFGGARPSSSKRSRNVRKDGGVIHCEWHNSSFYDATGRLASVLSQVLDVTSRQRAEDEARASEQRALTRAAELETVLDTVPAGVWIARDPRGDRVDANRYGAALLSLPRGVNVSLTTVEEERPGGFHVMKDGRELLRDELPIQASARDGTAFRDYEFDVVFDDGSVRHLLGNIAPVRDGTGAVHGSVGAFIDITERKRAEASAESLARFPQENPDPVLRLSSDFTVLYANVAACANLSGLAVVIGEPAPPPIAELAERALRGGQRFKTEIDCQGALFSLSLVPVGDQVNVYGQDITARKRAEQALVDADRRKTEFLAMLSHELRNPLTPIRNSVYILNQVKADSPQAARAREVIQRQTEHMTRLVNDLLDVTRISSGKIELQRVRLDVRDLVQKACDDYRSMFDRARVELRVVLPPRPLWIEADPTRLSQVIGNLLSNSVKFTPSGGQVIAEVAAREGAAQVSIRDNGVGIEPDQVEKMFEPFAQADNSLARTQGGLGLGLALVKGLVALHGGTVRARSEGAGRGAEFVFTIPLAAGADADAGSGPGPAPQPLSILVVEDNIDAGDSLAAILEFDGHKVQIARDGASAIALARSLRPDVVLCDIGLPDISGYEVARILRADATLRGTRLIAVSGYAQPEDRRRAAEAGFDAHFPKPPPLDELSALIARR